MAAPRGTTLPGIATCRRELVRLTNISAHIFVSRRRSSSSRTLMILPTRLVAANPDNFQEASRWLGAVLSRWASLIAIFHSLHRNRGGDSMKTSRDTSIATHVYARIAADLVRACASLALLWLTAVPAGA